MKTIQLSKWQLEILKEAFAMMAREEQLAKSQMGWRKEAVTGKQSGKLSKENEEVAFAV